MNELCEGRVCIVTGAGRGIGREHALLLADHGARVVVNDVGADLSGSGEATSPAEEVVGEIAAAGGVAEANFDDVATWEGAASLVEQAIGSFGRLDVLVNNAGILRDSTLATMTEDEWDAVVRVHLKGTAGPSHHAAAYWRSESKAGREVTGRIINTTSPAGLYGNPGQTNYGAAKAGIAAFTIIAAKELERYGVTVNAVCPVAATRMTEAFGFGDDLAPKWVSPVVCWLASIRSSSVSGHVFDATGRGLAVLEGWHRGPSADATLDPTEIGPLVEGLLAEARPPADLRGQG